MTSESSGSVHVLRRRSGPVGQDATDYRVHTSVAPGGAVMRSISPVRARRPMVCDACSAWVPAGTDVVLSDGPGVRFHHHPSCPPDTEVPMSFPDTSVKGKALDVMLRHASSESLTRRGGPRKYAGFLGVQADVLAREVGVDLHEMVHVLHDLREQGLVTFRTRHLSGSRKGTDKPERLRLTPVALRGLTMKAQTVPHPAPTPEPLPVAPPEPLSVAPVAPVPVLADYPALRAFVAGRESERMERARKREAAVALLREVGLEDAASLAEAEDIPVTTDPVLADVLRLLDDLNMVG